MKLLRDLVVILFLSGPNMPSYKHNALFIYSHYIEVTCVISIGYLDSTVQYFGGDTLMYVFAAD